MSGEPRSSPPPERISVGQRLRHRINVTMILGPLLLWVLNIPVMCWLSNKVDLTPALNWGYISFWPINARYIITLRAFNVPENEIAYVALTMANTATIGYFMMLWLVGITGFSAVRDRFGRPLSDTLPENRWKLALGAAFFLIAPLCLNFSDGTGWHAFSVRNPITVGLAKLDLGVCFAFGIASFALCLLVDETIYRIKGRVKETLH
ncbi:hypothetical protein [Phyllobacterium brassicacearum]|nr:hypothetical protein [Phyllobacterium brassicacearum]TDQ32012.1 hypothetical protein DEV91_106109 [Phyllobacterium brassicacearum]